MLHSFATFSVLRLPSILLFLSDIWIGTLGAHEPGAFVAAHVCELIRIAILLTNFSQ